MPLLLTTYIQYSKRGFGVLLLCALKHPPAFEHIDHPTDDFKVPNELHAVPQPFRCF